MADILIIKHGSLGDILVAEGAFRDLRHHHGHDRITVLTTPPYRQLFERCPWVDRVQLDPRAPRWRPDRMWQLRGMLRVDPVAMVYDLQNSPRTHFYYRYLFPPVAWSGTAPDCSHPHPSPQTSFGTDRLVAQLEAAGVPAVHARCPRLTWLADDAAPQLEAAGVEPPYVVLVAGSSARNQGKRWCHYHALAAALLERGHTPITVPGPDELTTDHVLPGVRVLHEGRPLNLSQLAGVLHNAAAVIGNDSGPTHLGAFLDTPGIALFGGRTSHIKPSLEAAGFLVLERSQLPDISVEEVLAAFDSLPLREGGPQKQVEAS